MFKVTHMVHKKLSDGLRGPRSIALAVDNSPDNDMPHISISASKHSFRNVIYFNRIEDLQELVNVARSALGEWMVEELAASEVKS